MLNFTDRITGIANTTRVKSILVCCMLCLLCLTSEAAENQYFIKRISPDMSLNYSSVRCILQDSIGFLWIGTGDGLYRYDTQTFTAYTHENGMANTIPSNSVNGMVLDRKNRLLIATQNGICIYDYLSDDFEQFRLQGRNPYNRSVKMTGYDVNGDIWLLDDLGIGRLLTEEMLIEYIPGPVSPDKISCFYIDLKNTCWIGTTAGNLYAYSPGIKKMTEFHQAEKIDDQITRILNDGEGIWLGYDNSGLVKLDFSGRPLFRFSSDSHGKYHLKGDRIRDIMQDNEGKIWIGTFPGIHIIKNNRIDTILLQETIPDIPDNSIWSFYQDRNDNIWIGTFLGGLALCARYNSGYYHYDADRLQVSRNFISSFCETDQGDILIGTERAGLFLSKNGFNEFNGITIRYRGKEVLNIKTIHKDERRNVWVGTYDSGLWYRKKGKSGFSLLKGIPDENSKIFSIVPEEDGLWVGSYQYGLLYYDFESQQTHNYSNQLTDNAIAISENVRTVFKDSKGSIWVGSDNVGLSMKLKDEERFIPVLKHNENLSSSIIYCIHEDTNQRMWIGTNGNGIIVLDPETDSITSLSKKDGLAGNEVYSIIEDDDSTVWLATEIGLCKVDMNTGEVLKLLNKQSVDINYNPGASYRLADGGVLFGGTNGFVVINEEAVRRNNDIPGIIISDFTINNQNANLVLEEELRININLEDTLVLNHEQNNFGFKVVAANYFLPENNKFRYRLNGYHADWFIADSKADITYINVPPGSYTFECYVSNNDGVWTPEPRSIRVIINPVFWRSTFAIILYILAGISVLTSIFYISLKNQRLRNEYLVERLNRENDERLHNMKIKFFTNISHELRAPLTLILGPLRRSVRSGKLPGIGELKLMFQNSSRLLQLINQILQFRKIEMEDDHIHLIQVDIVSFVKDIFERFSDESGIKGINMLFQPEPEHYELYLDKEKTENILSNLISNAIKYTPPGKSVTCRILLNESITESVRYEHSFVESYLSGKQYFEISIEDEGPGIEKKNLPEIFNRFTTLNTDSHYEGTGIGLSIVKDLTEIVKGEIIVLSAEHAGSVFALKLPLYSKDEVEAHISAIPVNIPDTPEHPIPVETISAGKEIAEELTNSYLKKSESYVVIIDDDQDVLDYLASVLDPYFIVFKESSAGAGLATIKKRIPDIIISDVMMPEIDGFELCKKVKSELTISHIPFIFITALSSMEDEIRGLKYGAVDYISKPFDEEIVLLRVFNLLKDQRLLRESFVTDYNFWKKKIADSNNENHFINNLKGIILENIRNTEFNSNTLADKACLSRSQCYRKLKMLTDQSPTEFIKFVRVHEAVRLMKEGETNIQSIGFEVGFNSPSYFTRTFKKLMEVSPSEYITGLHQQL